MNQQEKFRQFAHLAYISYQVNMILKPVQEKTKKEIKLNIASNV